MIVIVYRNGQVEMFAGESLDYFREHGCSGKVPIDTLEGDASLVYNEDIRRVTLVPAEKWTKIQVEHKAKREAAEQAEKKEKDIREKNAAEAKAQLEWDAAALAEKKRANAVWRERFFLARWFTRKPFPEIR